MTKKQIKLLERLGKAINSTIGMPEEAKQCNGLLITYEWSKGTWYVEGYGYLDDLVRDHEIPIGLWELMDEMSDLSIPDELSATGVKAAKAILELLAAEDATCTGGCRAFYSTEEWKARNETCGLNSLLIVAHDGGELAKYFNLDYENYDAVERMRLKLEAVGLYPEQGTSWYSAVYRT